MLAYNSGPGILISVSGRTGDTKVRSFGDPPPTWVLVVVATGLVVIAAFAYHADAIRAETASSWQRQVSVSPWKLTYSSPIPKETSLVGLWEESLPGHYRTHTFQLRNKLFLEDNTLHVCEDSPPTLWSYLP
jgi:hypothetical protein